jgi:ADP-heptose:LPS heptosyltransferase
MEAEVVVVPAYGTSKASPHHAAGWDDRAALLPPQLSELPLGSGETVVFCGGGPEWAPHVLAALAAGRYVLAPQGAAYASYLEGDRGQSWDPAAGAAGLLSVLEGTSQDPGHREAITRRAAAWARRWTVARTAAELEQFALALAADRPSRTRPQPEAWVLRREIGIGDVVFGLCSAQALKQRDPHCRVTYHTAPEHREWVSRFPCVDEVTSGAFQPPPGVRVVDWETNFPSTVALDRATAMGQIAGVEACWPRGPQLPAGWLRQVRPLLPPRRRLRIAFAPVSKGTHVSRSLPLETAVELAELLQQVGEVVWVEAELQPGKLPGGVTDLSGRLTLPEVVGVLAQCDVCVSVDSGLLFLAAALGTPVVGLFTHIGALQRLWLAPQFVALQPSLPCAPCGEGLDAFACLRGRGFREQTPLPCVRTPWKKHLAEAVQRAITPDPLAHRVVWNLAPGGERLAWDVDTLPAPWLLPSPTGGFPQR